MDLFLTVLLPHLALLLGLVVVLLYTPSLSNFLPLYGSLTLLFLLVQYYWTPFFPLWQAMVVAALGLLLTLVTMGLRGEKVSVKSYEGLMVAVGLFPWYEKLSYSLIYGGVACALFLLTTLTYDEAQAPLARYSLARWREGWRRQKFSTAAAALGGLLVLWLHLLFTLAA